MVAKIVPKIFTTILENRNGFVPDLPGEVVFRQRKKSFNIKACTPRRWENQIVFLRAFFGKGSIALCLRMTEKIEEYDEMTCES